MPAPTTLTVPLEQIGKVQGTVLTSATGGGGHTAFGAMLRLTRQGGPGCWGPIILITSFAPLKFSAVLGFYDMAWVTPAIIYV